MARGFPDYNTMVGTSVGGEVVDSTSFTGAISAGADGNFDFGSVSTGKEKFYRHLVISCPDDTAVHFAKLIRISDGFLWWSQDFVTGGSFDIPAFAFAATAEVRLTITNNASPTLTFRGAIFSVERDVT